MDHAPRLLLPTGVDIRASAPARYATGLIGLIGGISRVADLASPVAYRIMDALAVRSPKKFAQRILREAGVAAAEGALERVERLLADVELSAGLNDTPRTADDIRSSLSREEQPLLLDTLERLTALGVVRRGFRIACPRCATPGWHSLDSAQERIGCPGCSYEFPLPVRSGDGGGEMRWQYTLNSLADRVMDQDVLPVLLALHHLTRDKEAACIEPGLELLRTGSMDVSYEFDLIFVSAGQLSAGECKAGRELGDKDFTTARLASDLGISHFYFASPFGFSTSAVEAVEQLANELGRRRNAMTVTVLGRGELLGAG